jgi:hypothetical protein
MDANYSEYLNLHSQMKHAKKLTPLAIRNIKKAAEAVNEVQHLLIDERLIFALDLAHRADSASAEEIAAAQILAMDGTNFPDWDSTSFPSDLVSAMNAAAYAVVSALWGEVEGTKKLVKRARSPERVNFGDKDER